MENLCECGCDQRVKSGNRFINGHSNRGKHFSKETKRKMSVSRTGHIVDEETKKKISESNTGKRHTKEAKEAITRSLLKRWTDSSYKRKMKKLHQEKWKNLIYREKQLKAIFVGSAVKPNRTEITLDSLLQKLLPGEYRYVGDGSILIGYKNPDFVNVNGQKKIIELFGDYWHSEEVQGIPKEQHEQERKAIFAKYGYETLVIWEKDLENVLELKEKILEFNKKVKGG